MEGGDRLAHADRVGLKPEPFTRAEGRKFGLTVGIAFLVLTGVLLWRDKETAAWVTGALGALLILGGLAVPAHMGPVHRAWMGLAHAISRVTTPIVMGLLYFLVLTPTGVLRRLFGGTPLRREEKDESFWVDRGEKRRGDLRRQF